MMRMDFLKMVKLLCWTIGLLTILSQEANCIAVMSVDLGSEWMKVAIVSPGVPMEIALNRDSQRKTPMVVAFRDGERSFDDAAVTTSVRFPEKAFIYFVDLLGKNISNRVVKEYLEKFPYYQIESNPDTGGITFRHPEGMTFTPEELVAMMLKHAQEIGQNAANQPIKDVVVTVPAYFNQAERRALANAVELAGLNMLQLLSDSTAVALNYGVFRRKEFNESATNILFYDMGASSTVATVVSYQMVKSKERGFTETAPQLSVTGVGYDRSLGGLEFQLRLRNYFATEFNSQKKTSVDVFENKRALAKLYKEAGRMKKVLSANTEHIAQVENVMDDIDFKQPITRAEFEDMCDDLFDRVGAPIDMALGSAGITLEEINQVIIVGGNTRIPKVQQKLLERLNGMELGKSVNADEAAALGAAYQAAYLSKGFKVKVFHVKEANLFPIQVAFQRVLDSEEGKPSFKVVRRLLFNRNNPYPQKKVMTFTRHVKDFDISINYGDLSFLSRKELRNFGSLNLSTVHLSGVEAALAKHAESGAEPKGVKVHFRLDESGILRVDSAEAVFEKATVEEAEETPDLESTLSRIGSTIGRLFGGGSDAEEPKLEEETADQSKPEEVSAEKQDSQDEKSSSEQEKPSGKEEKLETEKEAPPKDQKESTPPPAPETKKENATAAGNDTAGPEKTIKMSVVKEPVKLSVDAVDLPVPKSEQVSQSVKKLNELDEKDKAKLDREKSKNALESFILETKDRLYSEEFEQASTESEREKMIAKLNEDAEWLEYESDEAATQAFKDRRTGLNRLTKDLFDRVQEHRERPQALNALNNVLNASEVYLKGIRSLKPDDQIFTDVEIETLEKAIKDVKKWKGEKEKEQKATPLHETPKLTLRMIFEKIQLLDRETKYLLNKARITPPKKKENDTAKESSKAETKEEEIKNESEPVAEPEEPLQLDDPNKTGAAQDGSTIDPQKTVPDSSEEKPHSEL